MTHLSIPAQLELLAGLLGMEGRETGAKIALRGANEVARLEAEVKLLEAKVEAMNTASAKPLAPYPWTIHSADDGVIVFESKSACWAGYRPHWEPGNGYEQDMAKYPEWVTE